MEGEPPSSRAEAPERALEHAREHLERIGHRLLEQHCDRRTGAWLLVARSHTRRELVFYELRAERVDDREPIGGLRRDRLRRAVLAWLTAHPTVSAPALRFDRITVFVGQDGDPVGLDYEPHAF